MARKQAPLDLGSEGVNRAFNSFDPPAKDFRRFQQPAVGPLLVGGPFPGETRPGDERRPYTPSGTLLQTRLRWRGATGCVAWV